MSQEMVPENLTIYECYKLLKNAIDVISPNITVKLEEFKNELTSKLREANERIEILEHTNKDLMKQIEYNERELKKNNIIIFGLEEEQGENIYEKVLKFFDEKLEKKILKSEINAAHRFGRENPSRPKPVVVKFVSYYRKAEIFHNCQILKNSGYSIANDLTLTERQNQKVLRNHLKQSKEQNLNAYISKNKLYINNISYTSEELRQVEKQSETADNEVITTGEINAGKQKVTTQVKNSTVATPGNITVTHRTEAASSISREKTKTHTYPNRRQATRK